MTVEALEIILYGLKRTTLFSAAATALARSRRLLMGNMFFQQKMEVGIRVVKIRFCGMFKPELALKLE